MADNESVRVDDGSVVHLTESEEPTQTSVEHVLSEEAQAILDKILEKNVANFDRKTAGSVLTALMYNQMNDMLINACNQYSQNSAALKEYMRNYLPNFVDVYVNDDINEANPLVGTISNGLLVIDLRSALSTMLGSVYQNSVAYTDEQINDTKALVEDTKNYLVAYIDKQDNALTINTVNYVNEQDETVKNYLLEYIGKRLEGSNSPIVALTKAEIDTLIAGGNISEDYTEEFLAEEITNSEIDNIFNS